MIAIKTDLDKMPKCCDGCKWHECYPHPYRGWTDYCGLTHHCMDDDQPEEWQYNDYGRPEACPLIETRRNGHWIKHIDDLFPEESTIECDQCHEEQFLRYGNDDNFCPNCGARMENG